jgi:uncharacterized protein (TIGR00251 family)
VSVRIAVHVTPKSSRESIEVGPGGDVRVRVTAPPESGKANAAVCRLVAKALGVPKSAVRVVRGESARDKLLEVDGADAAAVTALRGVADEGV